MNPRTWIAGVCLSFVPGIVAAQAPPPVPPGSAGTVTLSRADYDRLLDLAAQRPAAPAAAPTAAALARADIRVRVGTSTARSVMRVDGEVFRPGIARVALIKGATLLDARMENRPLPVASDGDTVVAFVNGPSTFSATLEVGSAIAASPGRASFALPVPLAGSATAQIDVPGEQTDVHVGSGIVLRRAAANGRTIVDVAVPSGRTVEVSWSTHEAAPAVVARDVRLLTDVKSVVSIGDADVRLVALLNAVVVQGEPSRIEVAIPAGYELISASGSTLDRSETQPGRAILYVADPTVRRHQFLLSLERSHAQGSFRLDTGLPAIPAAQRETGEVGIEGPSTVDISSPEMPGLRRIDVRELDPSLVSIARDAMLAAYRYQRTGDEPPALTVDVHRFANAPVIAAVAERATATTLVTTEGRGLTEITLWLRNTAQTFMKVALPAGASIVSVDVAGSPAKPVTGADGNRVPLLRPGFRPAGVYAVSFVYLHSGTPFLKKGDMQMVLPKMDVPIDVLEWELFVPEQFKATRFDGNVIDVAVMMANGPGRITGCVVDAAGAPLPGVTVIVQNGAYRQSVVTNQSGSYAVSNVPAGAVTVTAQLAGFRQAQQRVQNNGQGAQADLTLQVGTVNEFVTVESRSEAVNAQKAARDAVQEPSVNVQNLQRRVAGVLPIHIDVPRTGTSHSFVKPLLIDEEAVVTFRYKRR